MNSINQSVDNIRKILENMPTSWLELTTHRLDIYHEEQAKSEFLQHLQNQLATGDLTTQSLQELPTAYDYIRLGHQLSSILEWLLADINQVAAEQVITFTSKTMPILAVVRKNTLSNRSTHIYYDGDSSPIIDAPRLKSIYGYQFELHKIDRLTDIPAHKDASVLFVTQAPFDHPLAVNANIDITVNLHPQFGSALIIHDTMSEVARTQLVKDIQHVRRRETIAITPVNALKVLQEMVYQKHSSADTTKSEDRQKVHHCIQQNTGSRFTPLVASSGLSIQYAIMMGLVENALTKYPDKPIKIMLPPNCYGGTNDQTRRIADLIANVEIIDLLVDSGQNLVSSLDIALKSVAACDGVPIVLAEIPTNPRVEVPNMQKLGEVLSVIRQTPAKHQAVSPVFIVDQTFCPNVKLLHEQSPLVKVKIVSFSSGSKFPSGGRCIAGYCATNHAASDLLPLIASHLILSDNQAVDHQINTLAENMPSMPERIAKAYRNTRELVAQVQKILPGAKINFVSDELAEQGFTPSVFSLDLPSTGNTQTEREENKRQLNLKLINHMIHSFAEDCKYCVSYGQLKGSYWTIPATSTQGTTKETDKDYIVRVALSPQSDVDRLTALFAEFCQNENLN